MSYSSKNYKTDGGDTLVIGGTLKVEEGAKVEGLGGGEGGGYVLPKAAPSVLGGVKQAAAQADSTASDAAGLVTDFNALLAKLRTAGILAN